MDTKKKIPPLGAVAAAKADEKTKAKAAGLFASLGALLGLGPAPAPTAGKMRKVTEKHTHMKLEEEEGGSDADSAAEEEAGTGETGSEADDSEGSKSSAAEEEEEEEEEEKGAKGKPFEEEEEASASLARALRAAYKAPAVRAAFLAALPEKHRAAASLRTPDRLFREARRATGAKTVDGAMTALSRLRDKAAAGDATIIRKTATLAAKVTKIEAGQRSERVNAVVAEAKASGHASSKDLRAQLRAYGNANGTKALRALVATLPKVRTTGDGERHPLTDAEGATLGAPGVGEQEAMMARMTAGLDEKGKADFMAEYKRKSAALNGAGRV